MKTEAANEWKIWSSNVSHTSRKPLQCIDVITPKAGHVVKVTFETIVMPLICTRIQDGFPSVFLMVGNIMSYILIFVTRFNMWHQCAGFVPVRGGSLGSKVFDFFLYRQIKSDKEEFIHFDFE